MLDAALIPCASRSKKKEGTDPRWHWAWPAERPKHYHLIHTALRREPPNSEDYAFRHTTSGSNRVPEMAAEDVRLHDWQSACETAFPRARTQAEEEQERLAHQGVVCRRAREPGEMEITGPTIQIATESQVYSSFLNCRCLCLLWYAQVSELLLLSLCDPEARSVHWNVRYVFPSGSFWMGCQTAGFL